ncbi:MAG: hypothetical protein HW416_2042 [Chloroflexi bacterium]|nr:hypothetical protein [Chloroflexota bacterium]
MSLTPATPTGTAAPDLLDEIVRRIVEVAHPERIIMFGSAARGEMGPHSDVDLLVIKSGEYHHRRLAGDVYCRMHGLGQALDVIVLTPEEIGLHRDNPWRVIHHALAEGRVIYEV